MRILQQSLENEGWWGKRGREMSLNGKSCPQDLQDRGGIGMDLYEYCMIWTQEISPVNEMAKVRPPSRRPGLLMREPDLLWVMQPAAKTSQEQLHVLCSLLFTPILSSFSSLSKITFNSDMIRFVKYTQKHTRLTEWRSNACANGHKTLKKWWWLAAKLRSSIYRERFVPEATCSVTTAEWARLSPGRRAK